MLEDIGPDRGLDPNLLNRYYSQAELNYQASPNEWFFDKKKLSEPLGKALGYITDVVLNTSQEWQFVAYQQRRIMKPELNAPEILLTFTLSSNKSPLDNQLKRPVSEIDLRPTLLHPLAGKLILPQDSRTEIPYVDLGDRNVHPFYKRTYLSTATVPYYLTGVGLYPNILVSKDNTSVRILEPSRINVFIWIVDAVRELKEILDDFRIFHYNPQRLQQYPKAALIKRDYDNLDDLYSKLAVMPSPLMKEKN